MNTLSSKNVKVFFCSVMRPVTNDWRFEYAIVYNKNTIVECIEGKPNDKYETNYLLIKKQTLQH